MSNKQGDGSLQSTKQMLDELDALMEKMLSLPVNDVEEAPAFQKEVVKPTTLSAKLTLLQSPALERTQAYEAPPPLNPPHWTMSQTSSLAPSPSPVHPAVNPPHFEFQAQAPAPQPAPLTNEIMPAVPADSVAPLLAQIPEPEGSGLTPWSLVVGVNIAFDGTTRILGGAGEVLRGMAGRAVLGFAGMGMLAVAVGWFLKDYLGWN